MYQRKLVGEFVCNILRPNNACNGITHIQPIECNLWHGRPYDRRSILVLHRLRRAMGLEQNFEVLPVSEYH